MQGVIVLPPWAGFPKPGADLRVLKRVSQPTDRDLELGRPWG